MSAPAGPLFMILALKMLADGTLNPGWFGHPGSTTITLIAGIDWVANKFYRLGEVPDYDQGEAGSLGAEARREGVSVMEKLYDVLLELDGKQALLPPTWRTQEALARADLTNWLTFPTELGAAPAEMVLMKVVPVDAGRGEVLEFYVFKFRTKPPHWAADKGWMAGVAGPYLRGAPPSADGSHTFSSLEPADSMTPEEHVGNVAEIIADWRADEASRP